MDRRIFVIAGALPIVVAFGALTVGLGLVVFGDNGSDNTALGSTAAPTSSADESAAAVYGIGWLGIRGGPNATRTGVAITEVVGGSPADDAGLAAGDLIVKFEGEDVTTMDGLASLIQQHEPGVEVTLSVIAGGVANPNGDAKDVDVTLGSRPANAAPEDKRSGNGWLGLGGRTVDERVEVTNVVDGSPADKAGIVAGDFIIAVDGEAMESYKALASLIRTHSPGDAVTITIEHDGDTNDVDVTLGERPKSDPPDIGGLLPDLGGILDGFDIDRLIGGELRYLDADGNVVTLTADAGEVTSISSAAVTVQPPDDDDKTFDIPADAHVSHGLAVGDNVIVISKDGEVTAVISTDFGKLLPFDRMLPRFNNDGDGGFDFGDLFPDGIGPHCTVEDGGVSCEFNVKVTPTPAPQGSSNES